MDVRFLIIVVLLAGCLGPSTTPAAPIEPPEDPPLRMSAPEEVYSVPNTQRESFLAISPDGSEVLACAHGDFMRPSWMFASTDGGATFQELVADVPGVAGDCEVAYAEDGTWAFLHSTVVGATVATTSDQGTTWTVNPMTFVPPASADRPWMSYVGNRLMIVAQPGPLEPGHPALTYSDDHGATWSQTTFISPTDTQPSVSVGRILVDPDGVVKIPMYRGVEAAAAATPAELEFGIAVSTDQGTTWSYEALTTRVADMGTPTGVTQAGHVLHWFYSDPTSGGRRSDLKDLVWDNGTVRGPFDVGTNLRWQRPWATGAANGSAYVLWQDDQGSAVWHLDLVGPHGNVTPISADLFPGYRRDNAEYAEVTLGPDGPWALVPDLEGEEARFFLSRPQA